MQFLRSLVYPAGLMPHGTCYLWTPSLIVLHVASDSLIALSYMSIPITLAHFIRKRRDIPFSWMFLCFGAFIVACGGTHVMEVWTIWFPSYWVAGGVKVATACFSVATAILLIQLTPRVLAMPGMQSLLETNRRLAGEVEQHEERESSLRRVSEDLEERVAERTAELIAANQEIRKLNAELELRVKERTAQLEAANRDLESFTYSVSHDLRAPLRHMDGFSQILVEEFGPQLPPDAKKHIDRVREATLHMGRLVDDLLNLARVGRGAFRIVPTDLNEVVAETILSLEAETRGREVEWRVGRLSRAECDPGLMRQVFFNLLSNALKFTNQRQKAVIENRRDSRRRRPGHFRAR